MNTSIHRDPRVYLAVERTFLAWLRTGIALMGFGFVVARFGLLLRELGRPERASTLEDSGIAMQFGVALVLIGVVVNLVSVGHYRVRLRRLEQAQEFRGPSRFALAVAVGLALAGVLVAVRLMMVG